MTRPPFPQIFNEYGVRFLTPEELKWNRERACLSELQEMVSDDLGDGYSVFLFEKPDELRQIVAEAVKMHLLKTANAWTVDWDDATDFCVDGEINTFDLADAVLQALQGRASA